MNSANSPCSQQRRKPVHKNSRTFGRGVWVGWFIWIALAVLSAAPGLSEETLIPEFETPEEKDERVKRQKKEAPPVLDCKPRSLSAEIKQGGTEKLLFAIRNAGGGTLKWSIPNPPGWLLVRPLSGSLGLGAEQTLTITIDTGRLETEQQEDEIVVEAPGAKGSPLSISVAITIRPQELESQEPPLKPSDMDRGITELETRADEKPVKALKAPSVTNLKGLGIRAGYMVPTSADRVDFEPAVSFGVFWRAALRGNSRFGYELELNFTGGESESGLEESSLVGGHVHALWRLYLKDSWHAYVLGGISILTESADDQELGSNSATGSSVGLGVGATFARRYDARLVYSFLIGSDNVGGTVAASLGVMF